MKLKKIPEEKTEHEKRVQIGKRSRRKGSNYERTIAKKLKQKLGVDFVRTPQSGGFAKKSVKADVFRGDIVPADDSVECALHFECKDVKTWSLAKWMEQAEADCPKNKIGHTKLTASWRIYSRSADIVCSWEAPELNTRPLAIPMAR